MTPKKESKKEKNINLNFLKNALKWMKRQATDFETIFADHIVDKRHVSGMSKGLLKLENINNLIKKRQKC